MVLKMFEISLSISCDNMRNWSGSVSDLPVKGFIWPAAIATDF